MIILMLVISCSDLHLLETLKLHAISRDKACFKYLRLLYWFTKGRPLCLKLAIWWTFDICLSIILFWSVELIAFHASDISVSFQISVHGGWILYNNFWRWPSLRGYWFKMLIWVIEVHVNYSWYGICFSLQIN